jgi:transcriptional regulator with XRE-family HTH domain
MLGWSQHKLATEADIARSTLALIEKSQDDVNNASRAKIQRTLEAFGIEFLPSEGKRGEGIRRKPTSEPDSIDQ